MLCGVSSIEDEEDDFSDCFKGGAESRRGRPGGRRGDDERERGDGVCVAADAAF